MGGLLYAYLSQGLDRGCRRVDKRLRDPVQQLVGQTADRLPGAVAAAARDALDALDQVQQERLLLRAASEEAGPETGRGILNNFSDCKEKLRNFSRGYPGGGGGR